MRALVYYGNKDVRLESNWKDPKLLDDKDAIIKGSYTSICATDIEEWQFGPNYIQPEDTPVVHGHEITGEVNFQGENLKNLTVEKRAQKGIFLAFQYPLEIPGVNTNNFLKTSLNSVLKSKGKKEIDTLSFLKIVKEKSSELGIDEKILSRQLNVGFSGGEKKKNEILQMKILDPDFSILDETDSGLDIDALKIVAKGVNSSRNSKKSFLVITHYQRLLDYIKPDFVHVLSNGKIVKTGCGELAEELEKTGYEKLN